MLEKRHKVKSDAGKYCNTSSPCASAPHKRADSRPAARIPGRPGPGEPTGFLVVPGRAERVRGRPVTVLAYVRSLPPRTHRRARAGSVRGRALRCGCCPQPLSPLLGLLC